MVLHWANTVYTGSEGADRRCRAYRQAYMVDAFLCVKFLQIINIIVMDGFSY